MSIRIRRARTSGIGAGRGALLAGMLLTAGVAPMLACDDPDEVARERVTSAEQGASGPPRESDAPGAEAIWRARGAAAIGALKQGLMSELTRAIAERGAENAIDVCRVRAPEIARAVGTPGIRVGRTSHRLRNPANAAPAWVAPLLDDWVAGRRTNEPAVVDLGAGRGGYVEPLFAGEMCLTCHGESLAPALEAKLSALYPEDRAVGFRAGELRGLAWAEIEAATDVAP